MNKKAELNAVVDEDGVRVEGCGSAKNLEDMVVEIVDRVLDGLPENHRERLAIMVCKTIKESMETLPRESKEKVACAMIACAVPILKEMTGMIKVNE